MTATLIHRGTGPDWLADDERALVERLRAGDESAFEALVRRHAGRMLAVARRFLRSEEDSADAVQDAFLSAFRALGSFAGQSNLGTWLHRIVVNACLMKLRAGRGRRSVPLDDLLPTFDETGRHARTHRAWAEHPPGVALREEVRAQVRACIDRLPEPHRTVLLLRDVEELDTDQAARHLGVSPGTVKTRLHRARQALRALLAPILGTEEAWSWREIPRRVRA
jgi:RNA polymerase sigma-70 factor (ECF subfamily)